MFNFIGLGNEHPKLEKLYGQNTIGYFQALYLAKIGRVISAILFISHLVFLIPGGDFMDAQTKVWFLPLVALLSVVMMTCAWLAENGKLEIAFWLCSLSVSACTMGTVIMCGGFVDSHITPCLFAPMILCFCMARKTEAVVIGSITFFTPLAIDLAARQLGWNIPDYSSNASKTANIVFIMVPLYFAILIGLGYLDQVNRKLHDALDKKNQTYKQWANLDPLTGVGNRRSFDDLLEQEMQLADSSGGSFSILYLDLNGFKEINDKYGHHTGDQILKLLAKRLTSVVRNGDGIARLGGDEFAIVISPSQEIHCIDTLIKRIRLSVATPMFLDGEYFHLSTSVGQATYPQDAASPSDVLRMADFNMYADKASQKLRQKEQKVELDTFAQAS